jgi:hypothetical protein
MLEKHKDFEALIVFYFYSISRLRKGKISLNQAGQGQFTVVGYRRSRFFAVLVTLGYLCCKLNAARRTLLLHLTLVGYHSCEWLENSLAQAFPNFQSERCLFSLM